ncbi:MAG TPA: hypothetical protein PLL69_06480 [Gemmatimonadales bacterium]|nr:hypothetical protein [Gemmatimonadales bacterium]
MDHVAKVQAILRRWDPLGIRPGQLGPADEYDSYAPHIVSVVARGCSREQLCTHLGTLSTDTFGVSAARELDWQIAGEILVAVRS